tara:strand:- start:998 stop:1660 length:663 start_codon:yes stop_codon:yes gene_type:complete
MKDYLSVFYHNKKKPITNYPSKFAQYNIDRFNLKNKTFLEIGCGRGDFINEFSKKEVICYATDKLVSAKSNLNENVVFSVHNISNEKLPYEDNFFDAIYTKSLIEHISNHEHFFKECRRVLKINGILITYTPDWETQYLHFYDDPTHIKPFTKITLKNCYEMYGFENCKVEKFYQLPFIWQFPFLKNILRIISFLIPLRSKIKLLRFSKELMLIGFARKS